MSLHAYDVDYEHIELFEKPALFSNGRIIRESVPEGWFCYDLRGSDYDPGRPIQIEESVAVNHAGTVLTPEPVKFYRGKDTRKLRDGLNFLGEHMTLAEFCEHHGLNYPADNRKYILRPASPEEAGLFYAMKLEQDIELGVIGHVRMDFGKSGTEFWHTWHPRGPEELNSSEFKAELQQVVDELRATGPLRDLRTMSSYCYTHGGAIQGGWAQNYGYIVETENYRYCLRCNPNRGDYNAYLTAMDLREQKLHMTEKQPEQGMRMGGIGK